MTPELEAPLTCEVCSKPCVGNICRVCDMWGDGLYDENKWTFDEDVRNG